MSIPYKLISITDRLVPYAEALAWQYSASSARRLNESPDLLFLLEHPPVITLGRSSVPERDFLVPRNDITASGIQVYDADRGGEITYHAPGQLVGYPILELSDQESERDLHKYLRRLEQLIIETIAVWGVEGSRKEGLTGVWVGDRKIAAIGIKVSRWVTTHGFALNINLDLSPMRNQFVPCGIREFGVTSLAELGFSITRREVEPVIVKKFEELFRRNRPETAV